MGDIIKLFRDQELTPEVRASLMQRITDLAIEISLLEAERERLQKRLQS